MQMMEYLRNAGPVKGDDMPAQPSRVPWISWFCALEGHHMVLEVNHDFIKDRFNLICLNDIALSKQEMQECLKLILSPTSPSEEDLTKESFLKMN